jgi:UDP-2,4-diacetamido-2,4,6-trideoxy-beta-L-altropyranose hydrolase
MLGLLVVRADGGSYIGSGHLLRCLSVASEWQKRGGWALVATKCDREQITNRIQALGIECVLLKSSYPDPRDIGRLEKILARSGSYAGASPNTWVLLDGHRFDATYQKQVKDLGVNLAVIDDLAHLDRYEADVIINHHLYAQSLTYRCPRDTRMLLGPRYCLIRNAFKSWTNWQRDVVDVAKRVLVTFGGADPHDVTSKVMRALDLVDIPDLEVKVVAGPANERFEALEDAARSSKTDIEILWNVSDMPGLMAWAEVAVCAASTTAYEMAFMGLPGLLIMSADDQRKLGPAFAAAGAARCLGRHTDVAEKDIARELRDMLRSKTTRAAMSEVGRNLVDGEGPNRVIERLGGGRLKIRRALPGDCRAIWKLANDPGVRKYSFSKRYIEWDAHQKWFNDRMSDESCRFYVITDPEGSVAGQIRFDVSDEEAEVSVSVISDKRGLGLGSMVIGMGVRELTTDTRVKTIHSYVNPENMASIKAFEKSGFVSKGYKFVYGQDALHLEWSKHRSKR